jgi:hypothetical protein
MTYVDWFKHRRLHGTKCQIAHLVGGVVEGPTVHARRWRGCRYRMLQPTESVVVCPLATETDPPWQG